MPPGLVTGIHGGYADHTPVQLEMWVGIIVELLTSAERRPGEPGRFRVQSPVRRREVSLVADLGSGLLLLEQRPHEGVCRQSLDVRVYPQRALIWIRLGKRCPSLKCSEHTALNTPLVFHALQPSHRTTHRSSAIIHVLVGNRPEVNLPGVEILPLPL